jgi:sRNA-binding protein
METIERLAQKFPVFVVDRTQPPKPLKIGVDVDVVESGFEISKTQLKNALNWYIYCGLGYQQAMAAGGPRYDLGGDDCAR